MAKKKRNNKLYAGISVIFGIIALVTLFLPAIAIKETETTYRGIDLAFGLKKDTFLGTAEIFAFSIMNLLTYLLVLAGIIFSLLGAKGKGNGFANFIAFGAFVAATVFFLLQVAFCVPNDGLTSIVGALGGDVKDALTLTYGSFIGASASAIGALSFIAKKFLK